MNFEVGRGGWIKSGHENRQVSSSYFHKNLLVFTNSANKYLKRFFGSGKKMIFRRGKKIFQENIHPC